MKTKILVPTNFSKKSESALDYALRLSALQPSEVYLFHVFESSMKNFSKVDLFKPVYVESRKILSGGSIESREFMHVSRSCDDQQKFINSIRDA